MGQQESPREEERREESLSRERAQLKADLEALSSSFAHNSESRFIEQSADRQLRWLANYWMVAASSCLLLVSGLTAFLLSGRSLLNQDTSPSFYVEHTVLICFLVLVMWAACACFVVSVRLRLL